MVARNMRSCAAQFVVVNAKCVSTETERLSGRVTHGLEGFYLVLLMFSVLPVVALDAMSERQQEVRAK